MAELCQTKALSTSFNLRVFEIEHGGPREVFVRLDVLGRHERRRVVRDVRFARVLFGPRQLFVDETSVSPLAPDGEVLEREGMSQAVRLLPRDERTRCGGHLLELPNGRREVGELLRVHGRGHVGVRRRLSEAHGRRVDGVHRRAEHAACLVAPELDHPVGFHRVRHGLLVREPGHLD